MSLKITFLGHSGFVFDDGTHALAVDPFLTDNPLAKHQAADIKATHLALTHGHADHVGDTLAIVKQNDATVFAAFEICEYLGEQGLKKLEPGNPGGKIATDFGYVAFTHAFHSSSYHGRYMGMPCGLILNIGGVTIYHAGDTGLFSDMKLIGEIYKPDIACLPIGDRFTMGPELATRAAELIQPRVVIPIHYNTWPPIEQDPANLKPADITVKPLQPGETWDYD
ncbi:MAG: metal-dependent hydrolase [Phycisphaeraceae bacterium]